MGWLQAVRTGDASHILSGPDDTLASHMAVFAAEKARVTSTVVDFRVFQAAAQASQSKNLSGAGEGAARGDDGGGASSGRGRGGSGDDSGVLQGDASTSMASTFRSAGAEPADPDDDTDMGKPEGV